MKACIIACRTLERELLAAMSKTGCTYPVIWLEAGKHNVPDARRKEIQKTLDGCQGYDTVLLAMSFCGSIAVGLESRDFQLVVPRCDDCISVLLGSQQQRREFPNTYFLTDGWLRGQDSIAAEYRRSLEKHGESRTKRIFSTMLANYENMAFVDTGCGDAESEIRQLARQLNLEYVRLPGTLSCLEALVSGNWDPVRFLTVSAHSTVTAEMRSGTHTVTVLPENRTISAYHGDNLLKLLQKAGLAPDSPCGGHGTCGKCRVLVDGMETLSCRTPVTRDMTVTLPQKEALRILQSGTEAAVFMNPVKPGHLLAFDIGTTTVVGCLLDGETGAELAAAGTANPQAAFGADLITRIRASLRGELEALTDSIRNCLTELTLQLCQASGIGPGAIGVVSAVGNPAMQQLFLGISPENLATVPYAPVLTEAKAIPCRDILPVCPNAQFLIIPDIGGFVGADTLGCILASKQDQTEAMTLLVDIGTNGELVLGNKDRLISCSTAAGPALEGANIRFGMSGCDGAIDHVWLKDGQLCCSVIGSGTPKGICGSGIIDAVAVGLDMGLLNHRGRILNDEHVFYLTEEIYLTQEDIRQVMLAKGAICAGILLMANALGIELSDIRQVLLAGAFGNFLNPESACRIGLLPPELEGRIRSIGNAALIGAKLLACDHSLMKSSQALSERIEFLELASLPGFPKTFAKAMEFPKSSI